MWIGSHVISCSHSLVSLETLLTFTVMFDQMPTKDNYSCSVQTQLLLPEFTQKKKFKKIHSGLWLQKKLLLHIVMCLKGKTVQKNMFM